MLNIYINTWGNYNENGADGGEWVTLPMEESDLEMTLERIAEQMGDNDPEWFINDYEWTTDMKLRDIGENESIWDLRDELEQLDELDEYQQKVFCAAVDYWGYQYVDIDDIDDYNLYEDIESEYDLGYYWVHDSGCYDLDKMGNLANYIDYEKFGRDISIESDGGFSSYGWIEKC